jgi:hypothetical protein
MKFESKLGLGEVCIYNDAGNVPYGSRRESYKDSLVKIMDVRFTFSGVVYCIEVPTQTGALQHLVVAESELVGDPQFDQESGRYPDICESSTDDML